MINLRRQQRSSQSSFLSPTTVHQCCKCCSIFGMVFSVFLIAIGPITLMVTSVEAIGGDTILWRPDIRQNGRILGGVSWAVGTVLLFICYQCYGKTENSVVAILTRYRRQRRQTKPPDRQAEPPHHGAMGDAVQLEEIPLNVTMSDVPLVGVSSDHSIASHHMTIESWLNKKMLGKQATVSLTNENENGHLMRGHHSNVCTNNNTEGATGVSPHYVRVENPEYVRPQEIAADWQTTDNTCPQLEACASQEFVVGNFESCSSNNTKCTQTDDNDNDTILHQHFSPQKVVISAPGPADKLLSFNVCCDDKASQTAAAVLEELGSEEEEDGEGCLVVTERCCVEPAPQILGSSPRADPESQGDTAAIAQKIDADIKNKEANETDDDDDDYYVPTEEVLKAIASLDKLTEELEAYSCEEEIAPVEFEESFEESADEFTELKTQEEIRRTLDSIHILNKDIEGNLQNDVIPLPVTDDKGAVGGEAQSDVTSARGDVIEDPGEFVDPLDTRSAPVEVFPSETEQINFNRAQSSQRSMGAFQMVRTGHVTLLETLNQTEVQAAGDTKWQGRTTPRESVPLEDEDTAPLGDFDKDQAETLPDFDLEREDQALRSRAEALTPDRLIHACDEILDSNFKRRSLREQLLPSAFSTPNVAADVSSQDPNDKDSSSSSGFSEGACASDGSILVPSSIGMVHTLSESYVTTPTSAPPPGTISLESPEVADDDDDHVELNSSCNSNSPEKVFPLQLTSANTDLLAATACNNKDDNDDATATTNNNNNFNSNNINRNNNLYYSMASKSEGSLATPPPSSSSSTGFPAVSCSHSSTSFHSTTTDSTMYSAQDTLSFDTVVDSDDDYQNDLLFVPAYDDDEENPDADNQDDKK